MIILGKICICDVCGKDDAHGRWIYDPSAPKPRRCKNRKCRSTRWDTGGMDKRTWERLQKVAGAAPRSQKKRPEPVG